MEYENIKGKTVEILEYIKKWMLSHSYPPSVRDIASAVSLKSTASVQSHIEKLAKFGYIKKNPATSRSIELLCDNNVDIKKEVSYIPEIGTVAAGVPIFAEENATSYFPIPVEYLPNNETFILKVQGESMIDVGIYDGDRVIVEKNEEAYNGEIVVALVDDSATVKRFYKEDGHIRLQPENMNMQPIFVDDCKILGKVIGLYRFGIK